MHPFLAFTFMAILVPAVWPAPPEDERAQAALARAVRQHTNEQNPCFRCADTATDSDKKAREALTQAIAALSHSRSTASSSGCLCGCQEGGPCDCPNCPAGGGLTYTQAVRLAMDERKPLAVFVGQRTCAVPGCILCQVDDFPDTSGPCVVIGLPRSGKLFRVADIPGRPSSETIRSILTTVTATAPMVSTGPSRAVIPPPFVPPFFGGIGFGGRYCPGMGCGGRP